MKIMLTRLQQRFGRKRENDSAAMVEWDVTPAVDDTIVIKTETNSYLVKLTKSRTCCWKENFDDGCWDTGCNQKFVFEDGTPKENGVLYCYHCGGRAVFDIKK